jgi:uncharacterized protein (DUF1800 family)
MSANAARDACLRELENPRAALITDPSLPGYEECCRISVLDLDMLGLDPATKYNVLRNEVNARIKKHLEPDVGFVERLVLFWSNHFNVHTRDMSTMMPLMGNMERSAIRPHVLGKFPDMLKAVMRHPAMLRYLDNDQSVGPKSARGLQQRRSYNENLAREILELHTLGVGGGYTQQDIINLALILTGWTVHSSTPENVAGQFYFDPASHEPGSFTVLGRSFAQNGITQGMAALDMLALHPKTAEHIAFKLVQHFVTDTPAASQVRTLARVFTRTKGDLKAVAAALVRMSAAWTAPLARIRQPYLWGISVVRAVSMDQNLVNDIWWAGTKLMWGNLPWERETPDGYPDENYFWENAIGMQMRMEAVNIFMQHYLWRFPSVLANVGTFSDTLLPGAVSPRSKQAVSTAASQISPGAGVAMLFITPEFMRR